VSVFTYRLCVAADSTPHAYEVGRWPDGADPLDPAQYAVAETIWGQEAAAGRANFYNANPPAIRKGEKT